MDEEEQSTVHALEEATARSEVHVCTTVALKLSEISSLVARQAFRPEERGTEGVSAVRTARGSTLIRSACERFESDAARIIIAFKRADITYALTTLVLYIYLRHLLITLKSCEYI